MEYTHSDIESYTVGGSTEDHTYTLYDKIDEPANTDKDTLNKTIYGGRGVHNEGRLASLGVPIIISVRRNPIVQENMSYSQPGCRDESSGVMSDEMYDKIISSMVQLIEPRSSPRTMKIRLSLKITPKTPKTKKQRKGR